MIFARMVAVTVLGGLALSCSGDNGPEEISNSYSLLFDGVDDYGSAGDITVTLSEMINQMSVSIWFKKVGAQEADAMMLVFNPELESGINSMRLSLFWPDDSSIAVQVAADFADGPTAEIAANVSEPDAWNHVVLTFDAGAPSDNVVLYLNGEEVGSDDLATPLVAVGNIQFGRQGPGVNHYSGFLDEVTIWEDALTPEEAADVYNSGRPVSVLSDYYEYSSSMDVMSTWRMGDENVGDEENVSDLVNLNHFTVVGGGSFEMDTP